MNIDEAYYSAVDLLKTLISIPSLSREEEKAAEAFRQFLTDHHVEYQTLGNNTWCSAFPFDESKPTILLNSHIDTIKAVSGWQRDAFTPSEEDGKLYGLGSNDAGGPLVSLLHTFLVLREKPQAYNLLFLASCEEEVSGKNGAELAVTHLPKIDFGIVGEPTKMNAAIAEKGLMVLDCVVHGKSGHAAREEGVNAIYEAIPIIEKFKSYQFPKRSELLGPVKMTVSVIHAGLQHNIVPDKCEFTVDVRTNECYSNEEVFEILKSEMACDITPRSFRLNSSNINPNHPFVQRAVTLGKTIYGSPTMSDQTFMHFPTVKMGPGDSARSHTADEYIFLAEIREAIEIYVKLLDGLKL
ncbi:MAG: M20 family metallo-hydrolase [Bacteroidales bacterium]|nr:M20 family metallo-hydrolase [Bacteroidales bacterium]